MKYGEHTPLVEEVIAFACGGGVLAAVGPAAAAPEVWITNDLRLAVELNGGEGESARFRLAPDVNATDWGNTDLLGHNLLTGENLTVGEVQDALVWTWEDLTENLVADLIYTTSSWERPDRMGIHDPLFEVFHGSPLERQFAGRLQRPPAAGRAAGGVGALRRPDRPQRRGGPVRLCGEPGVQRPDG
jgi:hypothetical protein